MSATDRTQFIQRAASQAVTDLGVVLLQHYDRVSRDREEALQMAFDALLNHLRTLAEQSNLVRGEVKEKADLLRAMERKARGLPERQPLDDAGLL